MCYTSLISTWATVIFKQFLTMDHFPMLCRILKYVSFSGPFPWHSNKCAVHRLTTKVYTKPCISISTPRREPTRYWFANIVQWLWVVVGQPASQPHLKFSKKNFFPPRKTLVKVVTDLRADWPQVKIWSSMIQVVQTESNLDILSLSYFTNKKAIGGLWSVLHISDFFTCE